MANLRSKRHSGSQKRIVLDVNPEIADDASVLNSNNTHVVLNEVLTDTQKWVADSDIKKLSRELTDEITSFKSEYRHTVNAVNFEIQKIDHSLTKLEYLQNNHAVKKDQHIDFGFLTG